MTTASSGLYGNFGQANYGAAKVALVGLMQTLGIEGEKYNVRVNRLAPTAATAMTDGVLAADALAHLAPEAVSPGLLALVGADAPTRAILCAVPGHFAAPPVTLKGGIYVVHGECAAHGAVHEWEPASDRRGAPHTVNTMSASTASGRPPRRQ